MISDEKIRSNRAEIIGYLKSVNRDGIKELINFLYKSGYFYLYGSFKHHVYKGGLAQHSLEVLHYALDNNKDCDRDSIIIAALLHDLCKTNYPFEEGVEFVGHGSKSVQILQDFLGFELTEEEWMAIRYHMGGKCFLRDEEDVMMYEAARETELWKLIHIGDCISAGHYPKPMHGIVSGAMKTMKL